MKLCKKYLYRVRKNASVIIAISELLLIFISEKAISKSRSTAFSVAVFVLFALAFVLLHRAFSKSVKNKKK